MSLSATTRLLLPFATAAVLIASCQDSATPTDGPLSAAASPESDRFRALRQDMVHNYVEHALISDPLVLQAMRTVLREEFVLPDYRRAAYAENALPIREGQTISQPYTVALMTELLDLQPAERVLEVGTGSGYQAAVLAEITDQVYTVEIIANLSREADERLNGLGYEQVDFLRADGYYGWEEYAPYDAIIVTAAPDHVPQPLLRQLKDGGNLVIPVGPPGAVQSLWLIQKRGDEFIRLNKGAVRFVPFLRE